MLKLQFKDRRRDAVWLVDAHFTIGKAPTNSLMINESDIKDFHLEIINDKDDLTLINTANSSSLLLNGKPVARKASLAANDVITIGTVELELIDPKAQIESQKSAATTNFSNGWSIYSNASWLEKNHFLIHKKTIIGRDASCDITLPLDHLSRKHVSLEVRNNVLIIEDLDSSNGTFLNGNKIKSAEVKNGDKIKLDVVTFEVQGPSSPVIDPNKTIIRTLPLKADNKKAQTTNQVGNQAIKDNAVLVHSKEQTNSKKESIKPNKKRLSAQGKQKWISGQSTIKQPQQKKTGKIILLISAVIVASISTYLLRH